MEQGRLPLQTGENGHHPGHATLCQNLVHDIRMAGATLGHGHLDVVDHDRIGAAPIVRGAQSFPSQGIDMNDRLLGLSRHGLWRRRRPDVTGGGFGSVGVVSSVTGALAQPVKRSRQAKLAASCFFMIHTPQVFRKMGPAGTSLLPLYPVHEKSQCSRRNSPGQQHLLFKKTSRYAIISWGNEGGDSEVAGMN